MIYLGRRGGDENPLYHCRTWSFNGICEKYTLIFGKALFP
jgi:hypothetical protein